MTHSKDIREQLFTIFSRSSIGVSQVYIEEVEALIEPLLAKTEVNTLARASKIIKEEILGCDGYEKESDSIRCQWCGETEFNSNHAKARVLAQLTKEGKK